MPDISVTPANVLRVDGATEDGIAGETITAGQAVYLDSATGLLKRADANGATAALATVQGVALHGAATNQPLRIQTSGTITIGATVVVGGVYVLSVNPGGIAPVGDLAAASYVSILGVASTATALILKLNNSGVAHA
jgi:hypothetical protein